MIIGMDYTPGLDESELRPIVNVLEAAFLDVGVSRQPLTVIDGLYAIASAINSLTLAIETKG
jgi:hypothetical protein